ncbi:MAG: hypothetical protein ACRDIB_20585 [Ardenticatenaceae bacterium]
MLPLILFALWIPHRGEPLPTAPDRAQSAAINDYWTEVLAYPLEPEAALSGHWGDLTAFWHFQHGQGLRPDLWAIFPPNTSHFEAWLSESGRPLYLAGPLLDWNPEAFQQYELTPWGNLVRVAPRGTSAPLLPLQPRTARFGGQLELVGYQYVPLGPQRRQLWLAWRTISPTSRDLAVSLRLHVPDGTLLYQEDGRLASLWYPDSTLLAEQSLSTAFDFTTPRLLPAGTTIARIVVYDPATILPLLNDEGMDVVELGIVE